MFVNSDCNLNTDKNVSTYYNSDSDSKTDNNINISMNKSKCLL